MYLPSCKEVILNGFAKPSLAVCFISFCDVCSSTDNTYIKLGEECGL